MSEDFKKYYEILGLNYGTSYTKEDIEKAYKKLAFKWHPDKFDNNPTGHPAKSKQEATERFQKISEARDILTGKNDKQGPDKTLPEPCDYCSEDCNLRGGFFPEWKEWRDKKENKTHTYFFCSKNCYDNFFVCWECGRTRKKGENVKKGSGWLLKDYLAGRGGSFCSAACQQKFQNRNLQTCPFCKQQYKKGVYFKDNPGMVFCSEKCARNWEKEVWNKKNLAKQRQSFIEETLKSLEGWNLLSDEEKKNFINQVNNSEPKQFRNIWQQAKKLISEKQSDGEGKGKENGNNYNNNGPSQSEGEETGNETEGDSSDNNSEPNSDDNSNTNELPENIQAIAHLPLPQAQQKSEQEIEKSLKENGISDQELNKEDWLGGKDWKDYLKSLDTPQKVAEFTHKIQQSILKRALANPTSNGDKKPNNDWILPAVIIILSLLALITLIIIIRKRKKQRGF
jgi:hypothetical protein